MRSVVKYLTLGMRILGLDASFTQLQQLPKHRLKSDNLLHIYYAGLLGCWVDHLINQVSDGPGIILID